MVTPYIALQVGRLGLYLPDKNCLFFDEQI